MIDFIKPSLISTEKAFEENCNRVAQFLDGNPALFKVVLVASHFFRAASMYALMQLIPFSFPVSCAILITSSLLYRAAIERFCSFRFTIPSLLGALAFECGRPALVALSAQKAFLTLSSTLSSGFGIACLGTYFLYTSHLSHVDVEKRMSQLRGGCCCP